MADEYGFTTGQRALLEEMLEPEYAELFMRPTGSYQDIALSSAEVREIIKKLPADLSEERRQVVLTAYQLLGKVNYFWGGTIQIIHCASSQNNVVVTGKSGFASIARPHIHRS